MKIFDEENTKNIKSPVHNFYSNDANNKNIFEIKA